MGTELAGGMGIDGWRAAPQYAHLIVPGWTSAPQFWHKPMMKTSDCRLVLSASHQCGRRRPSGGPDRTRFYVTDTT
jgi:hypothetical protein